MWDLVIGFMKRRSLSKVGKRKQEVQITSRYHNSKSHNAVRAQVSLLTFYWNIIPKSASRFLSNTGLHHLCNQSRLLIDELNSCLPKIIFFNKTSISKPLKYDMLATTGTIGRPYWCVCDKIAVWVLIMDECWDD